MSDFPRIFQPPIAQAKKGGMITLKYIIDRIFSVLALALLSPLFAVIALAIKGCDGGPVFFLQDRHGIEGKLFKIYKFRSMIVDADRYLDEQGRVTIDNRVTWVGKILRRTSLDELPQLINIAKGDMSLIGPRPLPPARFDQLDAEQRTRFAMRPGLTGLAQINGRNTLKWSARLAFDAKYIREYSLRLDAVIFLKTFRVVLSQEGVVLDRNPEQADDLGRREPTAAEDTNQVA